MLQISVYEAIRILDLLQDAGVLAQLPAIPEDSQDFDVGNSTYMIEVCECGETTCLVWKAINITTDFGREDNDFDLLISLAVRAKHFGYDRLSDYLVEAYHHARDLAFHLTNTKTEDWVNTCKLYDPLVVGLSMSLVNLESALHEGGSSDPARILHPTLHHVH